MAGFRTMGEILRPILAIAIVLTLTVPVLASHESADRGPEGIRFDLDHPLRLDAEGGRIALADGVIHATKAASDGGHAYLRSGLPESSGVQFRFLAETIDSKDLTVLKAHGVHLLLDGDQLMDAHTREAVATVMPGAWHGIATCVDNAADTYRLTIDGAVRLAGAPRGPVEEGLAVGILPGDNGRGDAHWDTVHAIGECAVSRTRLLSFDREQERPYETLERNGRIGVEDGLLHMNRSQATSGYAEIRSDISEYGRIGTFGFETRFMIPHLDNHWFYVIDGLGGSIIIDYGSTLRYYNGDSFTLARLEPGQWYDIGFCVNPVTNLVTVTLDGTLIPGAFRPRWLSFPPSLRLGEPEDGGHNWGEAYWDHVDLVHGCTIGNNTLPAVPDLPFDFVYSGGVAEVVDGILTVSGGTGVHDPVLAASLRPFPEKGTYGMKARMSVPTDSNGVTLLDGAGIRLRSEEGHLVLDAADAHRISRLPAEGWHDFGYCIDPGESRVHVSVDGAFIDSGGLVPGFDAASVGAAGMKPADVRLGATSSPVTTGAGPVSWASVARLADCPTQSPIDLWLARLG